jgi:hypothetical protein
MATAAVGRQQGGEDRGSGCHSPASRGGEGKLNKSSILVAIYLTESLLKLLARARQHLVGTGIRRNPEESGGIRSKYRNSCPRGIPAKNSCDSGKKQEFLQPPPKPCSCEKLLQKTQEKKKFSRILAGTVFLVQKINS